MRGMLAGVLAVLFASSWLVGCHQMTREDRAAAGKTGHTMYDCPQHPGVTSDRPGNCPQCGMVMKKMEAGEKGQPCGSCGEKAGGMKAGGG